jgi:nucleoside phosphorylase
MTVKVLLVEDDDRKAQEIQSVVEEKGHMLVRAADLVSAKRLLAKDSYDAALLDIQIPIRAGEAPEIGGGGRLIREIESNSTLRRPKYVVGISQYHDADERCGKALSESAFGFIHYDQASSAWRETLAKFLQHVEKGVSTQSAEDRTDLVVICALYDPELTAVLELPCEWRELEESNDSIVYFQGVLKSKSGDRLIIAAACMEPGMSAAAALTATTIARFRPRYVAMTGITGGMRGSCNLGDVVMAEAVWDYTNGKHAVLDGKPAFRPAPRVIDIDPVVISQIQRLCRGDGVMKGIADSFMPKRPEQIPALRVGPMFTGTAVVADSDVAQGLEAIHRKVVGVEMEGYGVACAVKYLGHERPEVFILKGVSDFADERKDDDWHAYASFTSAQVLYNWALRFL